MNQSAGSVTPLSADEILTALGSGKWPVFRMDSVGGSANAITASVSGLTLTSGQYFWLVPASNSSSTTVNLNLNSGGNVRVKKADGSTDPASGDLQAGVIALLYYDGTYYRQMTGMPVSATYTSGVQPGSSVAQSYNNPGGTGARGSLITATNSAFFNVGNATSLINGSTSGETVAYFVGGTAVSGHYLRFDFGVARKITEAKWYQSATDSHGTWKWQGSQDASSWTDIGSSFTFGGATTQTQTELSGNSTAYRYYQLLGVSGTAGASSWIHEMEFKIDDNSALNLTGLSVSGLAQFQGFIQLLQLPSWPAQAGSYVWIAPATTGGAPAFRAITRADIGNLGIALGDLPNYGAGTTYPNDGNWYNLYSLAAGSHSGEFKISSALFSGLVTFSITNTNISLINDGWGGSYADVTASSGKIAFRVSGGWLQINVGTGISSTPKKFRAEFAPGGQVN